MRAERPTVLVVPRSVKVVMISTLQRLSSVYSLWHPPAAACIRVIVTWHQSWSPTPAQVNQCRLLALPVKTSSYIVPVSVAVSVPVRQTSKTPAAAAWTRVSFSVFHMLQSSAAVHWSARTVVRQMRPYMQRVGGMPTARPL